MTRLRHLGPIALTVLAVESAAEAAPPMTPGLITTKIGIRNDDRGGWSSMATTNFECAGPTGPTTCQRIGIAYYDFGSSQLKYSTSIDGGATFTVDTVDFEVDADLPNGGISLVYRGTTALIAYQADYYSPGTLKFAEKVPVGTGNCGSNNWICQEVSSGGYDARMVIDAAGKVTIVAHAANQRLRIHSADPPYTQWTAVNQIGSRAVTQIEANSVAAAIGADGVVHAAWAGDGVFYSASPFTSIQQIDTEHYGLTITPILTLAMNEDAELFAAYSLPDGVRISEKVGPWWVPATIQTFGPDEWFFCPQIIFDDTSSYPVAVIGMYIGPGEDPILALLRPSQQYAPWTLAGLANRGGRTASAARLESGQVGVAHHDPELADLLFTR